MKQFLHVGCGPKHKDRTTAGFNNPDWHELRLDIDKSVNPDIVGTMMDMSAVALRSRLSMHPAEGTYHEGPRRDQRFTRCVPLEQVRPRGGLMRNCFTGTI